MASTSITSINSVPSIYPQKELDKIALDMPPMPTSLENTTPQHKTENLLTDQQILFLKDLDYRPADGTFSNALLGISGALNIISAFIPNPLLSVNARLLTAVAFTCLSSAVDTKFPYPSLAKLDVDSQVYKSVKSSLTLDANKQMLAKFYRSLILSDKSRSANFLNLISKAFNEIETLNIQPETSPQIEQKVISDLKNKLNQAAISIKQAYNTSAVLLVHDFVAFGAYLFTDNPIAPAVVSVATLALKVFMDYDIKKHPEKLFTE